MHAYASLHPHGSQRRYRIAASVICDGRPVASACLRALLDWPVAALRLRSAIREAFAGRAGR